MKRNKPLRRKTPLARGSKLRAVSPKLAGRRNKYRKLNAEFMARPENKWCPVARVIFGLPCVPTTEVHHKNSRHGEHLNNVSEWLAVSRMGHDFIHGNPNKAREFGWLT